MSRDIRWDLLGVCLLVADWVSVGIGTGVVLPGWEKQNSDPLVGKGKEVVQVCARQLDGVCCINLKDHYY